MGEDDRLVDGMEFGKSHECSPGRKEREWRMANRLIRYPPLAIRSFTTW
jgi:hypothetical protein